MFAPAFIVAYNFFPGTALTHRLVEVAFNNWQFWATLVLVVAMCYVPVVAAVKARQLLVPRMVDLVGKVDMGRVNREWQVEAQRQAKEMM